MRREISLTLLAVMTSVYLAIAGLFALQTPAWQTPDEPAHYNYIAQIAVNGCCPEITMGDWDQAYLETLKASRFDDALLADLNTIQYEDHQPPLYYLLASPIYTVTRGDLGALRLFSAVFGVVIILCAFGVGAAIFPNRPEIGLGAAAFVAFLPQHVAILASVNNDALAWALVAMILLGTVLYVNQARRIRAYHLGILVGLGLITKASTYIMAGVVVVAIGLRWWTSQRSDPQPWRKLAQELALFLVPALLLGGVWWLRNFTVYGFPDFLGLAAHDAVVVGQLRTEDMIAGVGLNGYLRAALQTTYYSFWGMFGWLGVPMPTWMYAATALLTLTALVGWIADALISHREPMTATQRNLWVVLATLSALSILAYLYYNTEFVQFQARYMFPLLIPVGLALALGLDGWRRLFFRSSVSRWSVPLVIFILAAADVWLLIRVIVPGLTP